MNTFTFIFINRVFSLLKRLLDQKKVTFLCETKYIFRTYTLDVIFMQLKLKGL